MSLFHKTIGDVLKTFIKASDDLKRIADREGAAEVIALMKASEYRAEAELARTTAAEAARIASKIEALIS
jgi:hypothetical protein